MGEPTQAAIVPAPQGMMRWWVYQKERFPLIQHGLLILAFSGSAVCFSHILRGATDWPNSKAFLVAFVTCFSFFLQLRIADEFKDAEEDQRYRPYRPVPRGLVTLRQLGLVFAAGAALQLALALWLDPRLILLLAIAWFYLAAMSKEFFARNWLKARPITYMWSHMFIMPLVDLYATGCDWMLVRQGPPRGLIWFLIASYFNGMVIEIGRKIRVPADEETGVQTYSSLWGPSAAVMAWWGVLGATAAFATVAAAKAGLLPAAAWFAILLAVTGFIGLAYLRTMRPGTGKRIETIAGIWTLGLYLGLGIVPMAWIAWR